jgi:hypothetical protein
MVTWQDTHDLRLHEKTKIQYNVYVTIDKTTQIPK